MIPVYDRADDLAVTLRSVAAQHRAPDQVVVVDDGSSDGSAEVARRLAAEVGAPVDVVVQANAGVGAARNAGRAAARGDVLVFLDTGDTLRPRALAVVADRVARGADLVSWSVSFRYDDGREEVHLPRPKGPAFHGVAAVGTPGSLAVATDLFDAAGGFAVGLPFSENTELLLRIGRVVHETGRTVSATNEVLLDNLLPAGKSFAASAGNRLAGATYLLTHHRDLLATEPAALGSYLAIAGVNAARLGRYDEARSRFTEAARQRPTDLRRWARVMAATVPLVGRRVWPAGR